MFVGLTNPSKRNFIEGERLIRANHILQCGKNVNNVRPGSVSFMALCLQTTNLREKLHEICGEIMHEKIINCQCTCKAGLSEKCKHILATLLYLYRLSIIIK